MRKATASIISLLLLAAMVLTTAVSCTTGGNGGTQTQVTTAATTPSTTADPATAAPDIPDTLKFDGQEFAFYIASNYRYNDIKYDETAADQVNTARRTWLTAASEKFGVTITYDETDIAFGGCNGSGRGYSRLVKDNQAGDTTIDAAIIGTYDVAALAYQGYLVDLNTLPYVDLEKEWWDQKANQDLEILGKMYYTTGDLTLIDNVVTHCILFNKTILEENNLDDPYQLVKDNKWTIDALSGLVKATGVSSDLDNNGVANSADKFGMMTWNDSMLAILAAAGERIATINSSGEVELTLYSDRTVSLYDKFCALSFDKQNVFNYQLGTSSSSWDGIRDSIFNENRCLFYPTLFTGAERYRDSNVDFGILPYPKLDETQEEYGHMVSAFHCAYICAPAMLESENKTGAVLEWLAYTGKQTMTPAYYDRTLVGQYVRDDESVDMLDIIFASRVYDVGIYYKIGGYKDMFANIFANQTLTLTTIYERYKTIAETNVKEINDTFEKLLG